MEGTGREGRRSALDEVIVAASSLLDPSRLAAVAVTQVIRLLDVDGASLNFWDAEQRVLVPLAVDDERLLEPYPVYRPGQGIAGAAFEQDAAVAVEDYEHDTPQPVPWSGMASGLAVPLRAGGEPVGVIAAHHHSRRRFTPHDVELLEIVAAQVGPALATMGTLARAQRRTAEAYALARLMRRGASLGDEEALYSLVCQSAVRLLGADLAGLVLRDLSGTDTGWHGVYGNRTERWQHRRYGVDHPGVETIFSPEVLVVNGEDGGRIDPERYPFFSGEDVHTGVVVPLVPGDGRFGSLCLGWRFTVEMADGQRSLAEALAAFSGTLVTSVLSSAQRRALIDSAPVVLAALDADGVVAVCEGAAAGAIGVGPADVGRPLADVLRDEPDVLGRIEAAVSAAGPTTLHVELRDHSFDVRTIPRAGGALLVATDVTERSAAERTLAWQAAHDPLTGLANKLEVARQTDAGRPGEAAVMVIADVRSFDGVNEVIGYEAADDLLCGLAARLAAELADATVVGRTGGDEFAVCAVGGDPLELAHRVRASLEAPISRRDGQTVSVDVRCGVARGSAETDGLALLRRADAALQQARRGLGVIATWDAATAEREREQLALAERLRQAGDTRAFELAYQPILDARTNELKSVEALARWTPPDADPVPPDVFIPALERLGRIGQLTAHVLDRALEDVAGPYGVPVSINVSPLDVVRGDLARVVSERLSALRVDPSLLTLEITESTALEADSSAIAELTRMGVRIAIDDFGRGWSSIELLKRLPADVLKLDRSFVAGVAHDPSDEAILRAAVTLGRAFGMRVVAEGVEDDAVLESVRRLGCDYVQGFLLGRPMPAPALGRWIADRTVR